MIVAATGHRPDKLFAPGTFYQQYGQLVMLAVRGLERLKPTEVISGMAQGWDQAVAIAAVTIDIPFIAAVPFEGQERVWPDRNQDMYRALLREAAKTVIVCPFRLNRAFQIRDEWMMDRCQHVLALHNGSGGGTANTLAYNDRFTGWPVLNLWSEWDARQQS